VNKVQDGLVHKRLHFIAESTKLKTGSPSKMYHKLINLGLKYLNKREDRFYKDIDLMSCNTMLKLI